MLWACNFQPDKDSYGAPIIPDVQDCLIDMTMQVFFGKNLCSCGSPEFLQEMQTFLL